MKRVLRYLRGFEDIRITFEGDSQCNVVSYLNSDIVVDLDTRGFITHYAFIIDGSLLSLKVTLNQAHGGVVDKRGGVYGIGIGKK